MNTIDARKIVVRDGRQRLDFNAAHIMSLQAGLTGIGILHPIVLEFVDGTPYLLAGECRLRATIQAGDFGTPIKFQGKTLPLYHIAYTDMAPGNDLVREEIELAENQDRLNLSWQERDRAVAKIARLKGHAGEPASARDVAETINSVSENPISLPAQERKVKDALFRDQYGHLPQVANAKSAKEADKAIEKHLKEEKLRRLADSFKENPTEHTMLKGDCCEVVKTFADKSFDVVLADPIYGINMHEQNAFQREKIQDGKRHDYDDSWENFDRMFQIMPGELFRVCKDDAALYLFCDINRLYTSYVKGEKGQSVKVVGLADRFRKAGWNVWPRPLVWYKGNIGSLPVPDAGPRYTAEYILFARKGEKKTTGVFHDVINIQQTTGHDHPAGKPPAVYYDLLRRSANPGDRVLDFAAGSGPIFPAANKVGCSATGIELDDKYVGLAISRMQEEIE